MLSRWQQSGGGGKLLAQYVARLVTQKQLIVLAASLSSAAAFRCSTILKIDIYEVEIGLAVLYYELVSFSRSSSPI